VIEAECQLALAIDFIGGVLPGRREALCAGLMQAVKLDAHKAL
jgi:hypothetical protein